MKLIDQETEGLLHQEGWLLFRMEKKYSICLLPFRLKKMVLSHQDPMPDVDNYDDLPSEHDLRKKIISIVFLTSIRIVLIKNGR